MLLVWSKLAQNWPNLSQNGQIRVKLSIFTIAGWLANKLGRKRGIQITQIFSFSGAILSGAAQAAKSYEMLIIGRFGIGIACGLFTGLVPLYITEVAPVQLRGGMGTFNQLAVTSGIFMG